jgi:hypothetical protein
MDSQDAGSTVLATDFAVLMPSVSNPRAANVEMARRRGFA